MARVDLYEITDDILKTAILITTVGDDQIFELMVDLNNPKKPEDAKFDDLMHQRLKTSQKVLNFANESKNLESLFVITSLS